MSFELDFEQLAQSIQAELQVVDQDLKITFQVTDRPRTVMDLGVQEGVLKSLYTCLNGVYRMDPSLEDLVETSNNIARVQIK